MHGRFYILRVLVCSLAILSCDSGVGIDAPERTTAPANACTDAQPQLNYLNAILETQTLAALAPMVENVLFEEGAFRPVGQLAIALARQLTPSDIPLLVKNYEQGEGLARLSGPGFALLQYSDADNQHHVCGSKRGGHSGHVSEAGHSKNQDGLLRRR